jgi:hypothetical protein
LNEDVKAELWSFSTKYEIRGLVVIVAEVVCPIFQNVLLFLLVQGQRPNHCTDTKLVRGHETTFHMSFLKKKNVMILTEIPPTLIIKL